MIHWFYIYYTIDDYLIETLKHVLTGPMQSRHVLASHMENLRLNSYPQNKYNNEAPSYHRLFIMSLLSTREQCCISGHAKGRRIHIQSDDQGGFIER